MKKKIWTGIAVFAFAGAVLLSGLLLRSSLQRKEARQEYQELQQKNEENEKQRQEVPDAAEEQEPEKEKPDIPVDFEELWKTNEDIYAWITIPGTEIDYPVVQNASDNAYYLDHSAERKESVSGAIFSENDNGKDFEDPITLLYGHNMRDGSMFAGLHAYKDKIYMDEHQDLIIYLPEAILKYKIFAAYLTDNRHMLHYYNQGKDPESRKAYIRDILDQRTVDASLDTDAPVDEESKILTLSTCDSRGKNHRYLVQAYLVERIQ